MYTPYYFITLTRELFAALTYTSSLVTSLVAPFVIKLAGTRGTLVLGCLFYSGMYVGAVFLEAWTIYLGAIVSGKSVQNHYTGHPTSYYFTPSAG